MDEIVVHRICFFVALEFFLDLVEEALALVEWVVELVKGVAELDTADEDFESVDEIFIDVVSARKRANAGGVFIDKRRLDERLFDALFEDFHQKVSVALFGELFAANRFRQVCNDVFEEAAIGEFCFVDAEDLGDTFANPEATPRATDFDILAIPMQCRRLADFHRQRLNHLFDEFHQNRISAISHIEFHRRKFWVMATVATFIAEAAVELKDAFKAADDEAFEMELGRNAHIHIGIESIVMRLERACRRSPRLYLEHGRFDFHKSIIGHEIAQLLANERSLIKHFAHVVVDDEIDISLSITRLGIGQAMELFGQRSQALGEQFQRRATHC